jgi:hypothetical protein
MQTIRLILIPTLFTIIHCGDGIGDGVT